MVDAIASQSLMPVVGEAGWRPVPDLLGTSLLQAFDRDLEVLRDGGSHPHGLREAQRHMPSLLRMAGSSGFRHLWIGSSLTPVPIRAILLAKPAGANWRVPWHQDLVVPIAGTEERVGFTVSSHKAGVPHAQPPEPWLSGRVALRIHLDDCGPDDGPLRVLPGTHRQGALDPDALRHAVATVPERTLTARRGDALLLHPLLVHASSPAKRPGRRVLHLEFALTALPPGLAWASPFPGWGQPSPSAPPTAPCAPPAAP